MGAWLDIMARRGMGAGLRGTARGGAWLVAMSMMGKKDADSARSNGGRLSGSHEEMLLSCSLYSCVSEVR